MTAVIAADERAILASYARLPRPRRPRCPVLLWLRAVCRHADHRLVHHARQRGCTGGRSRVARGRAMLWPMEVIRQDTPIASRWGSTASPTGPVSINTASPRRSTSGAGSVSTPTRTVPSSPTRLSYTPVTSAKRVMRRVHISPRLKRRCTDTLPLTTSNA